MGTGQRALIGQGEGWICLSREAIAVNSKNKMKLVNIFL
jgi:hypothetical protein